MFCVFKVWYILYIYKCSYMLPYALTYHAITWSGITQYNIEHCNGAQLYHQYTKWCELCSVLNNFFSFRIIETMKQYLTPWNISTKKSVNFWPLSVADNMSLFPHHTYSVSLTHHSVPEWMVDQAVGCILHDGWMDTACSMQTPSMGTCH